MKMFVLIALFGSMTLVPSDAQLIASMHTSRDATVRIISHAGNSSGSGFFIADQMVLTCFHVVAATSRDANGLVRAEIFSDLQVVLPDGQILPADVVSRPSDSDRAPLEYDFALLKLRARPNKQIRVLHLANDELLASVDLGADVIFSGFPLAAPGMLTQKGMISGFVPDKSLLAIEGPVNKGNSGGALVDQNGNVIGIVSLREGGITQGLAQLRNELGESTKNGGRVFIMGIDPVSSTKMLIDTIDQYISVGIGYAINIRFAREYLRSHPALTRP